MKIRLPGLRWRGSRVESLAAAVLLVLAAAVSHPGLMAQTPAPVIENYLTLSPFPIRTFACPQIHNTSSGQEFKKCTLSPFPIRTFACPQIHNTSSGQEFKKCTRAPARGFQTSREAAAAFSRGRKPMENLALELSRVGGDSGLPPLPYPLP